MIKTDCIFYNYLEEKHRCIMKTIEPSACDNCPNYDKDQSEFLDSVLKGEE